MAQLTSSRQAGTGRAVVAAAAASSRRTSPRDLLLHTWPGRLFIISAALKLVVALARLAGELPRSSRCSAAPPRSA